LLFGVLCLRSRVHGTPSIQLPQTGWSAQKVSEFMAKDGVIEIEGTV